jgi:hypothetical protein
MAFFLCKDSQSVGCASKKDGVDVGKKYVEEGKNATGKLVDTRRTATK